MKDLSQYSDAELEVIAKSSSYSDEELERIAGTGPSAATEIKAKHAKNVSAEAAGYNPAWDDVWTQGYNKGGAGMGLANVVGEGLKGAGDAITGIPETIKGAYEGAKGLVDPANWKSAIDNPIVDLPANLVKGVTEPLISPRTTGKALTEAAAPALVGKAVMAGAKAAGPAAAYGARRITSSIVKPSLKEQAFTKDPTGAVLKYGIVGNSLEDYLSGARGVQKTLDDLTTKVDTLIDQSPAAVPNSEIVGLLNKEASRVRSQIGLDNKQAILSNIEEIKNDVLTRYGNRDLSSREVHGLRREIDEGIVKFTPDAVAHGTKLSKYQFRSGLNDILETAAPGIKALNMDVASLLSAKEAIGRRLATAQNASFAGPLDVAGEVAGTMMGAPLAYTGARLGMKAAGSTAVKSRAAQALESMAGRPSGKPSAAAQILQKQKSAAPTGEVARPVVKGTQLQPYAGPERRGPGTAGMEQRSGFSAAQQAAANPEIAQRAKALHEILQTGAGDQVAAINELGKLAEQYDWVGDYVAYGLEPVQRGGIRK